MALVFVGARGQIFLSGGQNGHDKHLTTGSVGFMPNAPRIRF
jgi:hypothetical protein